MTIVVLFLLGIANFALHKAVLESGHPLLSQLPGYLAMLSGPFSLAVEFALLLGAMLMASQSPVWAWGYAAYTMLNAVSGWLILSNRI